MKLNGELSTKSSCITQIDGPIFKIFVPQISDAAYNRERLILYRFGNLVRPIIGSGL